MFFQEAPAETFNYLVFGYAVILGTMALFVASLLIRFKNLRRDLELLDELGSRGGRVS